MSSNNLAVSLPPSSPDECSGRTYWDSSPVQLSSAKRTLNMSASGTADSRNVSASTITRSTDSSSSSLRPLTKSYSSSSDIPLLKKEDSDGQLRGSQSSLLGSQSNLLGDYHSNHEQNKLEPISEKGSKAKSNQQQTGTPQLLTESEQKRKTLYLSFCFAVLFSGFNPAQSFVTTVHADIGFYSLAVIYTSFAIGCLLAPSIGQYLKVKNSMFIGALTYIGFLIGLCQSNIIVILLLSAINGFGSGFMWLHQGVWFARISEHSSSVGKLSGMFFSIFSLNSVIGNLIVISVSSSGVSVNMMLWLMTGVATVGAVMYFFSAEIPSADGKPKAVLPLKQQLEHIWAVAKRKDTMLFAAYMIHQGFAVAFNTAKFPNIIGSSAVNIGMAFLIYGISSVLTSYVAGKVYDRWSWKPLMLAQAISVVVVGFVTVYSALVGISLYGLFGLACILGIVDNIINCLLNTAIVKNYDSSITTYVYAYYRCLFCVGFSSAAVFAGAVDVIVVGLTYSALGLLSIGLFTYLLVSVWKKKGTVLKEIITTSPEQSTSNTESEESTNSQDCEAHPPVITDKNKASHTQNSVSLAV